METVVEHTLSDVLRTPNPVLQEAERRDVLIRRRQADDLVLMDAKRARALRDTLGTFARLLHTAVQLKGVEGRLTAGVNWALPWTSLLPEEARRQFVTELTEMAGAVADTGNYTPLAVLLRDWQATANAYADPEAFKELTEPLEETELPSLLTEPVRRKRPKSRSTGGIPTSRARTTSGANMKSGKGTAAGRNRKKDPAAAQPARKAAANEMVPTATVKKAATKKAAGRKAEASAASR
jgi:hypothetical protein